MYMYYSILIYINNIFKLNRVCGVLITVASYNRTHIMTYKIFICEENFC